MAVELKRQRDKACFWCRRPMRGESAKWRPTRNHVIPRAQSGTIIKIACFACNQPKGDMPASLWVIVIEKFADIHKRFDQPGPRGMALFYSLFGGKFEHHIERIVKEAQARFLEYGEICSDRRALLLGHGPRPQPGAYHGLLARQTRWGWLNRREAGVLSCRATRVSNPRRTFRSQTPILAASPLPMSAAPWSSSGSTRF
jgi:hypothetical protein